MSTKPLPAALSVLGATALFRAVVDTAGCLVCLADSDFRYAFFNAECERVTGFSADKIVGLPVFEVLVPTDQREELRAAFADARPNGYPILHENDWVTKSGERRTIQWRNTVISGEDSEQTHVLALGVDVTEQRLTEERLRERERWLRTLLQAMHEGLTVRGKDGVIALANPAAERIMGMTADQLAGLHPNDPRWRAFTIDRKPLELNNLPSLRALATGQPQLDTLMGIQHPDGNVFWGNVNAVPIVDPDGSVSTVVTTYADVTELIEQRDTIENQKRLLEEANERLQALASTDGLTGLLNHRALQERLTEAYFSARRYRRALSAIMLDVDFFKRYNDAHGHWAGDEVLRTVARTLKQTARTCDIVGRYGGEEFLILLPETDESTARAVAERFRREVMSQGYEHGSVTASLGVASLSDAHRQPSDLLEDADRAMYVAKQSGRNQVMPKVGELSHLANSHPPVSSRP